jgi:hypothetical protein
MQQRELKNDQRGAERRQQENRQEIVAIHEQTGAKAMQTPRPMSGQSSASNSTGPRKRRATAPSREAGAARPTGAIGLQARRWSSSPRRLRRAPWPLPRTQSNKPIWIAGRNIPLG